MRPHFEERRPASYSALVALACVVLATLLRMLIDPVVDGVPFITFFPAVALAAYLGGPSAGAATMLVGGLVAAYLWVPPLHSLALSRAGWFTTAVYGLVSTMLIVLIQRLGEAARRAKAAEETSRLYAREMVHRTANVVTLVQALASMTFKDGGSPEEQRRLFDSRLVALGAALTAPMDGNGHQDVLAMARTVLLPFGNRIQVTGPCVGVTPEVAAKLALIFNELGTNAVKHGALGTATGSVTVAASIVGDTLVIQWCEKGGPPVDPSPQRRGFGSRLLNSSSSGRGVGGSRLQPYGPHRADNGSTEPAQSLVDSAVWRRLSPTPERACAPLSEHIALGEC